MAVIFRRRKGELLQLGYEEEARTTLSLFGPKVGVCTLCGEDSAVGWWRAHEDLRVCRACAMDALPKLLADVLVGEWTLTTHTLPLVGRGLQEFLLSFWRAVAIALSRVAEVDRREAQERQQTPAPPAQRNGHTRNGHPHN
jgi:hypothetical protein